MSGLITNYLGVGLAAARPATPSITSGAISCYLASDTGAFSVWGGSWATLGAGTVTSITGSGGTTGLTLGGGPITTSGTLTLSGTLAVANGGTGATTAGAALTNLGATTVGGNVVTLANPSAITFLRVNADNSVSALSASAFRTAIGAGTGTGTGDMLSTNNLSDVANAGTSRANLGLAIGTNVQAWDADLDSLAAASGTNTLYYRSAANTWTAVTIGGNLTFSGGTLNATQYYRIGFFFTTTPTVSEVIALHVVTDAFTLPANFATPDSKGSCGTNPTASFALDVQKNGSSIGTITISTGGAFTFATASGTSKSIAAGDVIKVVAPSPVDPTCANVAITLKGTI